MKTPIYLSAREAAAELGVQPATLYAYVSRGLIRSEPGPGKQRRYSAADVRALQTRRDRLTEAEPKSSPPLETRLTLITEEGPYYRGHSAVALAGHSSLEAVATLLWGCETDPFAGIPQGLEQSVFQPDLPAGLQPLDRMMMRFSLWPLSDPAANALARPVLEAKGARLLHAGVAALLNQPVSAEPIHRQLAQAWSVTSPVMDGLLRRALVLCADHELNTSAYTVRCAASTRAPLHACLLAGLGAFAGPRHGTHSERVQAWLRDIDEPDTVWRVFSGRLSRGEDLPGFGHILYTDQDPRAESLLHAIAGSASPSLFLQSLPAVLDAARQAYGLYPNIDFALVALQRAFQLPPEAPKLIFCAGRLVGWIAHALEQYEISEQIRPRAVYAGPRPA